MSFAAIEQRVMSTIMEAKAVTQEQWQQLTRRQGKSAMLGMMYGTGKAALQGMDIARPSHPLEFTSGYSYVGRDRRFGNAAVYKVSTKVISELMRKERVPHTELHYRHMDELDSAIRTGVAAIAWIRRSDKTEITTAIATLFMMGVDEVVLVRAFEP